MISRRALIGTGLGVGAVAATGVVGERTHRLDDWAQKLGIDPRRRPALADEVLIKSVQANQTELLMWTQAVSARQPRLAKTLGPLTANTKRQLDNLGGPHAGIDIAAPPASATAALDAVIEVYRRAEKNRAQETLEAISGDFAQVLASISASLSQSLVVLQSARKALV